MKRRPSSVETILPTQLLRDLLSGRRLLLIDVRDPSELTDPRARLPGAKHVPLQKLFAKREELAREKVEGVVTISNKGDRARDAALTLSLLGLPDVKWLEGGLEAWNREVAFAT